MVFSMDFHGFFYGFLWVSMVFAQVFFLGFGAAAWEFFGMFWGVGGSKRWLTGEGFKYVQLASSFGCAPSRTPWVQVLMFFCFTGFW